MLTDAFPQFDNIHLKEDIQKLSIEKIYKKSKIILRKGQTIGAVHIILKGSVKVYQEDEEGKEFVIGYLDKGDSFGVSITEDSTDFSKLSVVSFSAAEDTHLLLMSYDDKDMLAKKYDGWYKYILQMALKFHSFYIDLINNIAFKKMDSRIIFFLKRFSKIQKTDILQISHQEIADSLNSSREVVSRLLKKMEEDGKINMGHHTIKIIDL